MLHTCATACLQNLILDNGRTHLIFVKIVCFEVILNFKNYHSTFFCLCNQNPPFAEEIVLTKITLFLN